MNDLSKMFIGFDRMFDQMFTTVNKTTYPPYNVEIRGDDKYKLSMAVAGFSSDDLTISTQKNTLSIWLLEIDLKKVIPEEEKEKIITIKKE